MRSFKYCMSGEGSAWILGWSHSGYWAWAPRNAAKEYSTGKDLYYEMDLLILKALLKLVTEGGLQIYILLLTYMYAGSINIWYLTLLQCVSVVSWCEWNQKVHWYFIGHIIRAALALDYELASFRLYQYKWKQAISVIQIFILLHWRAIYLAPAVRLARTFDWTKLHHVMSFKLVINLR